MRRRWIVLVGASDWRSEGQTSGACVCRTALPFEGLDDARPGVALALAFKCGGCRCSFGLGGVLVADGVAVGELGLLATSRAAATTATWWPRMRW